MLPRRHRLRSSRDFTEAVRDGHHARVGPLVGYLHRTSTPAPPRAGLIVSRRVGDSVTRHRVSRVLRHGIAADLHRLPAGSVLVVRALPRAPDRDRGLAADVATLIDRLLRAA